MKRVNRVFSALLACMMILGLAGCGKMNAGGEGTNFPYFWKEEGRGTVLLKLDGTYGPEDYRWSIASTDESVLKIKVVKKEKNGIVTYRIKPLKEGSAQIVFVRQREVDPTEGEAGSDLMEGTGNGASIEASSTGESSHGQDTLQDNVIEGGEVEQGAVQLAEDIPAEEEDPSAAVEAAEAAMAASKAYEEYLDRFRAKDVIGEIKVRLDAEPTGKRGKLKLHFVLATTQEHKGIMQSSDGEMDYRVWEDTDGSLKVRLPELEERWSASWEGEYVPAEDPGIPGIAVSRPEMQDGRYIILEIRDEGFIEGAYCYTVRGLDQGTAILEFANPKTEKALIIDVMISHDGKVSVISHHMMAPQG